MGYLIHVWDVPYAYGTSHMRMGRYTHMGQNMDSELLRFNDNLRHSLSSSCNAYISDQSWLQATLPCSLDSLGFFPFALSYCLSCQGIPLPCLLLLVRSLLLLICLLHFLVLWCHMCLPLIYISEAQRIF